MLQHPFIHITQFHQEIRSGSSLPLVVTGSDGHRYVVKLRGGGDGPIANVVEWLSFRLAQLFAIPVPEPAFLILEDGAIGENRDPEIIDLAKQSLGINFGTRFIEKTRPLTRENVKVIDVGSGNRLFLYDLFLLNIDRTWKNPNMIVKDTRWWCVDFSSSVTLRSCLDQVHPQELNFLAEIKRHPFYVDDPDVSGFTAKLASITVSDVKMITRELPDELIQHAVKIKSPEMLRLELTDRLMVAKNDVSLLKQRLELLKNITLETDEERTSRQLQNRTAFERKFT